MIVRSGRQPWSPCAVLGRFTDVDFVVVDVHTVRGNEPSQYPLNGLTLSLQS